MDPEFIKSICAKADDIDKLHCPTTKRERATRLIKETAAHLDLSDARTNLAINSWDKINTEDPNLHYEIPSYTRYHSEKYCEVSKDPKRWTYVPEPERGYYHEAYTKLPEMSKGYYLAQRRKVENWAREDLAKIRAEKLSTKKILEEELSRRRIIRNTHPVNREEIKISLSISNEEKERLSKLIKAFLREKSRIDREIKLFEDASSRFGPKF